MGQDIASLRRKSWVLTLAVLAHLVVARPYRCVKSIKLLLQSFRERFSDRTEQQSRTICEIGAVRKIGSQGIVFLKWLKAGHIVLTTL